MVTPMPDQPDRPLTLPLMPDEQIREQLATSVDSDVFRRAEDAWSHAYAAAMETGGGYTRANTVALDAWRSVILSALIPVVRRLIDAQASARERELEAERDRLVAAHDAVMCPRCDQVIGTHAPDCHPTERERLIDEAIAALARKWRSKVEQARRLSAKIRRKGDLSAIGGPSDEEHRARADALSDEALEIEACAIELEEALDALRTAPAPPEPSLPADLAAVADRKRLLNAEARIAKALEFIEKRGYADGAAYFGGRVAAILRGEEEA